MNSFGPIAAMRRLRGRPPGPLPATADGMAAAEAWAMEDAPSPDGGFSVAPEAGDGVLSIQHVRKAYKARRVVEDVSMTVRRGEAVGLLGPNGAGKTTTFYMITGLVRPDSGSIVLDGNDVTSLPMYRRARLGIGYLPQEASVFRGLNVEQNVMAALEVI